MPRHRNIEEEFRAIAPKGQRGIPGAQPISVGVTGPTAAASDASREIALLEAQFRQQASLIQAQTQVPQGDSGGSAIDRVTGDGGIGGGLGLLSPVLTGLLSLFGLGGSKDTPAPLPFYTPPPSVEISDTLRNAAVSAQPSNTAPVARNATNPAAAPQVTVHVNAMDSQSFMDRSGDIANAVREAMLNLHPINDVVASL